VQFVELELPGAFLIEPDRRRDVRGYFARTWCAREFAAHGMERPMVQASTSFNKHQGTLRGLHYQAPPSQEEKLVRCSAGAIFDVIVDLRPTSPAFLKHVHFELSADNGRALFIPSGCAHGFQTLAPLSEVFYMMTDFFEPALSRGLRWNDPILDIQWPEDDRVIVERDAAYPDYGPAVLGELQRFPTPQKKNAD
jgi:dTDP-4-dehydrorhamnose 3,5-epimerase